MQHYSTIFMQECRPYACILPCTVARKLQPQMTFLWSGSLFLFDNNTPKVCIVHIRGAGPPTHFICWLLGKCWLQNYLSIKHRHCRTIVHSPKMSRKSWPELAISDPMTLTTLDRFSPHLVHACMTPPTGHHVNNNFPPLPACNMAGAQSYTYWFH
jgi:hypothetical protein